MENFSQKDEDAVKAYKSYLPHAAVSLILLLPMFFLTIPAIVLSGVSKSFYSEGNYARATACAEASRRCTVSAWALFGILTSTCLALYFISRLSLI